MLLKEGTLLPILNDNFSNWTYKTSTKKYIKNFVIIIYNQK